AELRGHGPKNPWRAFALYLPGLVAPALALALWAQGLPVRLLAWASAVDRFEPNDRFDQAREVAVGRVEDLRLPPGDVDWFRVRVPFGRSLRATATPSAETTGATSLHGPSGATLASDERSPGPCVYTPRDPAGEVVFVCVWGARTGPYSLDLSLADPGDRFEPNDRPDDAALLAPGVHPRIRCNGSDWFRIVQPAGQALRARLRSGAPGIGLRWVPATDSSFQAAAPTALEADLPVNAAEREVLLEVRGGGRYDLELSPGRYEPPRPFPPLQGLAEIDERPPPGDAPGKGALLREGRYTGLRCRGVSWFRVRLAEGERLLARLDALGKRPDLTLALFAPSSSGLAPERAARWDGDSYVLLHRAEADGEVFLRVRGPPVSYSLSLRTFSGALGNPLGPGNYANLEGGDDRLWRIPLRAGERLELSANYDAEQGPQLRLDLRDAAWTRLPVAEAPAGALAARTTAKTDGPVYLRVLGGLLPFDLTVRVRSAPGAGWRPPARCEAIGPGVYPNRLLAGERWYSLLARPGARLSVRARTRLGEEVQLEAFDARGNLLATGELASSVSDLGWSCTEPAGAPIYLRAFSDLGRPPRHTLRIAWDGSTLPCPPDRPALAPGRHEFDAGRGHDVHPVELARGQRLRVLLEAANRDAELDLAVLDGDGRELRSATELGRSEELEFVAPRAGRYHLRVFGTPSPYSLDLRAD
ncbi:MAG: hypothetical protein D6731_21175, partial [Planctomycetota bacterium]